MTAILKVDTIQDTAGNNIINESSDTITIGASGDTIALAGTTVTGITQGITMAQQWRLTSDLTGDANPISSNLEVVDTDGYGGIGSSMSVSSGTFTFPSTGIYHITFNFLLQIVGTADYAQGKIRTTTDNSTYDDAAAAYASASSTATAFNSGSSTHIFDVTDTSTHKVQFRMIQANTNNKVRGVTSQTWTGMTFIRLGDT